MSGFTDFFRRVREQLGRIPGDFQRLLRPMVFFYGVIAIQELMVKLFCFQSLTLRGEVMTLLLSLPIAAALGFVCGVLPRRGGKILMNVLVWVITIWVGAQIVYYSVFHTFLSLFSVTMAGMVAKDFFSQAIYQVAKNVLPITMLLVFPTVTVLLLPWLFPEQRRRRRSVLSCAGGALGLHLLCLLVILCANGGTMSLRYIYTQSASPDLQVSNFGILTATALDFRRSVLPSEGEDVIAPAPEPEPEPPVDVPEPDGGSEEPPEPVDPGDNVLEIDFDALMAGEEDPVLLQMHQYFSQRSPTAKNQWTGYFAGKNLIWIVAEAYSSLAISPELTPNLYRLSQEGFRFNNFYTPSWGVSTSDGEYVTTTGLLPKSGVWSYRASGSNYMPFGFGNLLSPAGYTARAYHNHTYTYYGRDISHPNMGYDYKGLGNGLDVRETWPESDVEMMELTVPEYIGDERFVTYYMTVSGHLQYNFIGNYIAYKNKDLVADLPYSEEVQAYLACQIELDRAVGSLIDQLEAAGRLEDTVIVLSGDHYPYGLTKAGIDELAGHEVDEKFELYKSRLLLWCASMEEPVEVDKYCSSLDVMPTLANLFGLPYDSRLVMGRDILSDTPGLVIFSNYSFLTDAGAYDSKTDEFTPWKEDTAVDESYARDVLTDVTSRFDYSRLILETDYYRVVFGDKTPWDLAETPPDAGGQP